MDVRAKENDMMPPLLFMPVIRESTMWQDALAEKQSCLLADFLQKKIAKKLANAQEETASQNLDIEVQNHMTLSYDLFYQIFVLLPAESLFRLQFVCKQWFSLINSSIFIGSHVQQSETVLISQQLTLWPQGYEDKQKSYFHFLNLDDGGNTFVESSVIELVDIQASYDGLVLATTEKSKSLVLMNPVTRKHIWLPLSAVSNFRCESFGIALCNQAKTYKLVHLFLENPHCIGCEILRICAGNWRRIEGPPFELLLDISQIPVSIAGTLYWLSLKRGCDYLIKMNVHDEKFVSKKLPVSRATMDWLLEIEDNLGFVTHAQMNLLQVWILITDGESRESWTKRYSIKLNVGFTICIPLCSLRNGKEMVFESPAHELYVYNFDRDEMKLVLSRSDDEAWLGWIDRLYIPHRNSLVSCNDHRVITL